MSANRTFSQIEALHHVGELDLALDLADKTLAKSSRLGSAAGDLFAARASIYTELGRTADAIADSEMAFENGTTQIELLRTVGFCHLAKARSQVKSDSSSAKEDFEQAIAFLSMYLFLERTRECYLARAEAFRELGMLEREDEDQKRAGQTSAGFQGQRYKKCEAHDSVLSIRRESFAFVSHSNEHIAIAGRIDQSCFPNKETGLPHMGFPAGGYSYFIQCPVCHVGYETKYSEKQRELWSAYYRDNTGQGNAAYFAEWLEGYVEAETDNTLRVPVDLYCGQDDLRANAPGCLLNNDRPGSDGNFYSIGRNEKRKNLWDLFQCVPKRVSGPGFTVLMLAAGLTVDELYSKLESVDILIQGHEAIALGLPFHQDNY